MFAGCAHKWQKSQHLASWSYWGSFHHVCVCVCVYMVVIRNPYTASNFQQNPEDAPREPKAHQRDPTGAPRRSKGHQRTAKGSPRASQMEPKGAQSRPKGSQRHPSLDILDPQGGWLRAVA